MAINTEDLLSEEIQTNQDKKQAPLFDIYLFRNNRVSDDMQN